MEPFIWAKVFDFSGNTILKILSFLFKVLVIVGVPALIGWTIYVTIIKPHTNPTPTTTQSAKEIINNYYYPNKKTFSLGCNLWGMDVGIVKYSYPDKPAIKKTNVKSN